MGEARSGSASLQMLADIEAQVQLKVQPQQATKGGQTLQKCRACLTLWPAEPGGSKAAAGVHRSGSPVAVNGLQQGRRAAK